MTSLLRQLRGVVWRWTTRILIAAGGHEMKVRLLRRSGVRIGKNCRIYTDHFGTEPYLIRIGDHCTVTSGVQFINHDGSCWVVRAKTPNLQDFGPIVIEDNSFIGINTLILPNVRIGPNSVVAAGAIVTKDVPPNTVAGGIPAKILMTLDEFVANKMAKPDATSVPTDLDERRRFLEEKYRGLLEPAPRTR